MSSTSATTSEDRQTCNFFLTMKPALQYLAPCTNVCVRRY
jgi:hypothetical protein